MNLNGFYNEEVLQELLHEEKITYLDYVYHHSQEMIDEFKDYCNQNNLPEDELSANKFLDWQLQMEEEAHTDGLD